MNLENRKFVFWGLFLGLGLVFIVRLFYMQVVDDHWIVRSSEVAQKKLTIKPPRGVMFDRNNEKVVANKTYYNIMFVENKIKELDTAALGQLFDMSTQDVRDRFAEIRKKLDRKTRDKKTGKDTIVNDYRTYLPHIFIGELNAEEMAKISIELPKFQGFYEETISMRDYPYPYGANIFGYLNEIRPEELNADRKFYRIGDKIGRAGLERYYEQQLRGQKGVKYILTSARGKVVDNFAGGKLDTIAKQGPQLNLGIDILLQGYGEQLMQNKRGSIVAIEPKSGEILALVSAPSYDPNLLVGTRNIKKNYNILYKDSLKPLFPRPLQAEYPPGSIFKVVQALTALQEEQITINTGFPCTKSWVGCHNHPPATTIDKAIQYSCNPYFYYVVKKLIHQGKDKNAFKDAAIGLDNWVKYMNSFGLGKKLETDISGIRAGVIPGVSFYNKWYGENRWQFSTIRSNAIGQGEVKVTPLQMANLAAIFANRGFYYEPHFVKSIGDDGPLERFKIRKETLVDKKHFDIIVEGMRKVVEEGGGTARSARIENISVAGKTGTAQNPHGKDHSVFIAFAPIEEPQIAIAVFIENAGFGGTWAAPIASLMIEKYINRTINNKLKEKRILDAEL